MSRWDEELSRVTWADLTVTDGPATAVPDALLRLSKTRTLEEGWKVYWELDNTIVVQGNLFGAAEAVTPFLVGLAIEHDDHRRLLALELLIQLVSGTSHPLEVERGNYDLEERCRERAKTGLEFFYSLLEEPTEDMRDRAVELIGAVEDDARRKRWTMEWVAERDPSSKTRQLATRLAREAV
jgi:hypothetical protein